MSDFVIRTQLLIPCLKAEFIGLLHVTMVSFTHLSSENNWLSQCFNTGNVPWFQLLKSGQHCHTINMLDHIFRPQKNWIFSTIFFCNQKLFQKGYFILILIQYILLLYSLNWVDRVSKILYLYTEVVLSKFHSNIWLLSLQKAHNSQWIRNVLSLHSDM